MEKKSPELDILRKSDVFRGLAPGQYDEVVNKSIRKSIQKKAILFRQGDAAKMCYLVTYGRLKLTSLNAEGKEAIIRYVGVGELTAAVAILKDRLYPVAAESVEETVVFGWDRSSILQLMRQIPDIAINLTGILLERLDDVQHRYFELYTEQVEKRIAHTILRLMRSSGSKTDEGIKIDIPLSRQSIAEYSGTTLYTVSRTLSSWEKNGLIKSGRERITVTDPHALMLFAEKS
jgi:CRP-like cAMP-binding protein